ncbi:hypothetical protein HPB51_025308 [Rhipicephalus microplus]|uniref:CCHC-type domain-containing protein n=1 Tax=Rhipicephalus microplus TaxID=6941 RepID=A0A9J6F9L9_RHIMP|nr:hypothetical protein HPB51_025308 [Rhipicephalus microplus]
MQISMPSQANAKAYASLQAITVNNAKYEVSSYIVAPDNTCKGIIRNVDMEIDDEELRRLLIQPRNPTVLEVRRIKNSTTVVILIEGLRVPNYVMCGPSIVKCTLYRRQTDICYTCGRLGHRADVCPTPGNVICRGCGMTSPGDQYVCSPKCAFCGGPHPTADSTCTQRFEIPYIVRQRRRERRDFDKDFPPIHELSEPAKKSRSQSRSSRGRSPYKSGPRSTSRSQSRSCSRSRGPAVSVKVPAATATEWADHVRGSQKQVTGGILPEQNNDRIIQLEKENAALKEVIAQLRVEILTRKKANTAKSEAPQPPQVTRLENPLKRLWNCPWKHLWKRPWKRP